MNSYLHVDIGANLSVVVHKLRRAWSQWCYTEWVALATTTHHNLPPGPCSMLAPPAKAPLPTTTTTTLVPCLPLSVIPVTVVLWLFPLGMILSIHRTYSLHNKSTHLTALKTFVTLDMRKTFLQSYYAKNGNSRANASWITFTYSNHTSHNGLQKLLILRILWHISSFIHNQWIVILQLMRHYSSVLVS